MERKVLFTRLNEVFQDVFDDEELVVNEMTSASDIDDWDSLAHITLLSAIEDEFNIKFNMKAIQQLKNVGEMADLIESLLH